jgi:hypothetical protein
MKIKNKGITIILITAIIMVSAFGYAVEARIITGIVNNRDIPVTLEDYPYLGNEDFSANFYLPANTCTGYINFCKIVYVSDQAAAADVNKDGKIDETDAAILTKSYGCSSGQSCWNQPVEECFFTKMSAGILRKFKDPTRDCKWNQADMDLITNNIGKTHNLQLTQACNTDPVCQSDVNQNGVVDILDAVLASDFNGKTADDFERIAQKQAVADLNHDGIIDMYDAILMSNSYGIVALKKDCSNNAMTYVSSGLYSVRANGTGINWIQTTYRCTV